MTNKSGKVRRLAIYCGLLCEWDESIHREPEGFGYSLAEPLVLYTDYEASERRRVAQLRWCYDQTISKMVKPIQTFDEWRDSIDAALSKQTGETN